MKGLLKSAAARWAMGAALFFLTLVCMVPWCMTSAEMEVLRAYWVLHFKHRRIASQFDLMAGYVGLPMQFTSDAHYKGLAFIGMVVTIKILRTLGFHSGDFSSQMLGSPVEHAQLSRVS